jgi:hypothetical protein
MLTNPPRILVFGVNHQREYAQFDSRDTQNGINDRPSSPAKSLTERPCISAARRTTAHTFGAMRASIPAVRQWGDLVFAFSSKNSRHLEPQAHNMGHSQ